MGEPSDPHAGLMLTKGEGEGGLCRADHSAALRKPQADQWGGFQSGEALSLAGDRREEARPGVITAVDPSCLSLRLRQSAVIFLLRVLLKRDLTNSPL